MTDPMRPDDAQKDPLDLILAEWTTPPASFGLGERIVASAPRRPRRLAVWWAGAAGVGLAGAVAGSIAAAVLIPSPAPPTSSSDSFYAGSTVFGDLDEGSDS
jgi:hypothetical protein